MRVDKIALFPIICFEDVEKYGRNLCIVDFYTDL